MRNADPQKLIRRYKVLCTILALEDFTEKDLANVSGVKTKPFYWKLKGNRSFVEAVDTLNKHEPGHQPKHYRLMEESRPSLQAEINVLFHQIREFDSASTGPEDQIDEPPSLIIAEDILYNRIYEQISAQEYDELLRLAAMNIESANEKFQCNTEEVDSISSKPTNGNSNPRLQSVYKEYERLCSMRPSLRKHFFKASYFFPFGYAKLAFDYTNDIQRTWQNAVLNQNEINIAYWNKGFAHHNRLKKAIIACCASNFTEIVDWTNSLQLSLQQVLAIQNKIMNI